MVGKVVLGAPATPTMDMCLWDADMTSHQPWQT
jgi:hypothetical protein